MNLYLIIYASLSGLILLGMIISTLVKPKDFLQDLPPDNKQEEKL